MSSLKKKLLVLILIVFNVKSEDLTSGSKCQTNDGTEGSCVAINNCNILQDKLRNRTIQLSEVTICNQQTRFVCCPVETSNLSSRLNLERLSTRNLIEDGPSSCGKAVIGFGTVFYGTQIKRGAYPWIAALTKTENDQFFCGGSLVSKNFVITAAHCMEGKQRNHIFEPKDIFAILGAHNLEAHHEPDRITSSIRAIHVHHDWNPFVVSFDADIAILELANSVNFNDYIQPICIAAPKSEAALKTDGVVVGFGRSENKRIENIARVITSPIHSHQFCANSSSHETLLTHRTFCGGFANGTSVCEGDSGSGLIVKHNGIYYLRGIVSASLYDTLIGCNINSYSVFTDTLEFYSWITTGTDDKVLLQTTLTDNKKLKFEISKSNETIQMLEEKIRKLEAHITTLTNMDTEYVEPKNKHDEFDWKLTKEILDSQPGNVLISPIGTKILLSLLEEAAGKTSTSKTRRELEQALPYNKNSNDALEYFMKVLTSFGTLDVAYHVNFATRIFVDGNITINQRFNSIAEHNYKANVTKLNFYEAPNSAKTINDWVKEVTRGNIKDLVSEDAIQKSTLVLINALYFEGTWRFPFYRTVTRDFFSRPNRKSSKKFMESIENFYYFYSRHLDAKILRMPYEGRRFSMFIVLPQEINGIDSFVEKLESNTFKNEIWHMKKLRTHVVIPKFKFDTSINLNDITKALGITEIFEDTAKFPLLARGGSSEGKLKVSNIIQKLGISVDEKAATAYVATDKYIITEPKEFIANHPFLFYIEDDTTGAKLFSGRVSNLDY